MCKRPNSISKARAEFRARLRYENITDIRELYDEDNGVLDLVGFFAVLNGTEAVLFDVTRRASVRIYRTFPVYTGMGDRRVAKEFGVPNAKVLHR